MNRLAHEKSPYLLQHKDNPVDWYPWGDEAFETSRRENRPIFLSIGYSTCHWCHVMEKDSFETKEVADVLNRYFVSIKVDREERPDVDQIYMDAVVGMLGHGGWPLSVFLTPDLKPFYGGTFYWKTQFLQLLQALHEVWKGDEPRIRASAESMLAHFQQKLTSKNGNIPNEKIFAHLLKQYEQSFDANHGGFGRAPKFPQSMALSLLLRIDRSPGKGEAPLQMVETTLKKMAYGGMYDHLGGGFHRYSTDDQWLVPHFEKMLYDNALLVVSYLEAYQLTKNEMYASVARETLDYILRDMTSSQGGFFSAEDADSEGEEGKFYVWTKQELKNILSPEEFRLVEKVYEITEQGNFEHHTNILSMSKDVNWSIKQDPFLQSAHQKLFAVRKKRIHPSKDDKILTSWNGLMISAMAKGYQVLEDERYLKAAQQAALFLRNTLYVGASGARPGDCQSPLRRRYRDGEAKFSATLEDYAYLISGLIDLYESDFNAQWIEWALLLQKEAEAFWDEEEKVFFSADPRATDLIVRKKDLHDGAMPSANSISILNLQRLYALTFKENYREKAEQMLQALGEVMIRHLRGFESAFIALDFFLARPKAIAIVGEKESSSTKDFLRYLRTHFLPNKVVALGEGVELTKARPMLDGKTAFYICEGNVCKKPTTDLEEARKLTNN